MCQLIKEYTPDIIGLAEYTDNVTELITELKKDGFFYYAFPQLGSRIVTISIFGDADIIHRVEHTHFVVKGYPYNDRKEHNVVFLHLPSKREDSGGRRMAVLRKVREAIENSDRNVIIGDFNMNPYEKAMVSVMEMNAIPTPEIAKKGSRTYVEDKYRFFYNPMWSFLGNTNKPYGSYYYTPVEEESIYWNVFDQIIVSSSLVNDVHIEDIKIIDTVRELRLNRNGKPDPSDHFPIYCELKGDK